MCSIIARESNIDTCAFESSLNISEARGPRDPPPNRRFSSGNTVRQRCAPLMQVWSSRQFSEHEIDQAAPLAIDCPQQGQAGDKPPRQRQRRLWGSCRCLAAAEGTHIVKMICSCTTRRLKGSKCLRGESRGASFDGEPQSCRRAQGSND